MFEDNSPPIYGWVEKVRSLHESRQGRKKLNPKFCARLRLGTFYRPGRDLKVAFAILYPHINEWAIFSPENGSRIQPL